MNKIIVAVIVALLFHYSQAYGQTIGAGTDSALYKNKTFSSTDFANHPLSKDKSVRRRDNWCGAHTAGLTIIYVGGGMMALGGILVASSAPSHDGWPSTGDVLGALGFALGAITTAIGTPMLIGGAIHDGHQKRLKLKSAKRNEIGVSYSF